MNNSSGVRMSTEKKAGKAKTKPEDTVPLAELDPERMQELEGFRKLMMEYQCALDEVHTKLDVLNKELSLRTNRNPFESIRSRIKEPGSIYGSLRGIDMRDLCACLCCSDGRTAGIGKEIQDPYRPALIRLRSDEAGEPVPVRGLFREKPRMLETERFQIEMQFTAGRSIGDLPFFRKIEKLPLTAAFAAAVIMGIRMFPFTSAGRLPDNLRIGPDQPVFAPALQFLSIGCIDHFIIFPVIRQVHFYCLSSVLSI
jgi:hypothetical protein